ncbi:MAG: hypothetical protein R2774_02165 [Saprospiraceae bacterium]
MLSFDRDNHHDADIINTFHFLQNDNYWVLHVLLELNLKPEILKKANIKLGMQRLLKILFLTLFYVNLAALPVKADACIKATRDKGMVIYLRLGDIPNSSIFNCNLPYEITEENETSEETNKGLSQNLSPIYPLLCIGKHLDNALNYTRFGKCFTDNYAAQYISLIILFHSWKFDH